MSTTRPHLRAPRAAALRDSALVRRLGTPWVIVPAIFLVAFAAMTAYVLQLSEFFVMPDELSYVKQGLAIWDQGFLLHSGQYGYNSAAQLQPLLLAPTWGLADPATAFDVSHVVNAAVMAGTVVPVYLLARRVLAQRPAAYAVAALSVAVPWLALAGSVMTENVAYPAFAWAALAMQATVASPSRRADVLALVAIGVAFFARTQFYLLVIVLLAAIVVHEVGWRLTRGDGRRAVREGLVAAVRGHVVLAAACVLAALLGTVAGTWHSLLGNYATVQNGTLLPAGTWRAGRELLDYVVVGIGILPLVGATAWAGATLLRPESRERHAYAVLLVGLAATLVLATGSFSVRFTAGPNDRYLFYLVPLLFLGLTALLFERRRLTIALAATGLVTAVVVHAGAYTLTGPSLTSASAAFHQVLAGRTSVWAPKLGFDSATMQDVLAAATVVLTAALVLARRFLPLRVAAWGTLAAIGVFCVAETRYTLHKIESTQKTADRKAALAGRGYLDAQVPDGQRVALILGLSSDPTTTTALFWDASFWNKKARRTYSVAGDPTYEQGFTSPISLDPRTGAISGLGDERYVAQAGDDRRFRIAGARILDQTRPLWLLRAPQGEPRAAWTMRSTDGTGRTPVGKPAVIRVYPPRPGARRVRVRLVVTTTFQAPRGFGYRLTGPGAAARSGRVGKGKTAYPTVTVDLPSGGGPAVLVLRPRGRPVADAGLHVLNVFPREV